MTDTLTDIRILGSQIQLEFLTKFPTFTPEQFNRALKQKNYFLTQSQIGIAQKSDVSHSQLLFFLREM